MRFTLEQISQLIEERVGLAVSTQMGGALDDILLSQSAGKLADYLARLQDAPETSPIWQNLLDALTIGETYFLRDRTHFYLLKKHILPQLIARRRNEERCELNVWSAGCASGEEPYSLAITLCELLPDVAQWKIKLIGTDINGKALQTAQRGVYRKWAFRHTDDDFQRRYFEPVADGLQIKPHIREMVTFRHANLLQPTLHQFDVILCRNVMLYFSARHSQQAEITLYNALAPGGWLLLGQAETIHHSREFWQMQLFNGAPVFQKPEKPIIQPIQPPPTPKPIRQAVPINHSLQHAYHDDPQTAENLLRQLLAQHPDHIQAHILLANLLANRQEIIEAHKQIDAALELNPLLADGYYIRAMLHIEEDDLIAAKKSLREALYCQRDHALAAFLLGNLYAQEDKISLAARHWRNAHQSIASLKPDDPVSDISDITAEQLTNLINRQLNP